MNQRLMKTIRDRTLGKESVQEQMLVIVYETGELAKCLSRSRTFPKERDAWLAASYCAIADILVQLEILCEELNVDFDAVLNLGEKRLLEKMNQIRRGKDE